MLSVAFTGAFLLKPPAPLCTEILSPLNPIAIWCLGYSDSFSKGLKRTYWPGKLFAAMTIFAVGTGTTIEALSLPSEVPYLDWLTTFPVVNYEWGPVLGIRLPVIPGSPLIGGLLRGGIEAGAMPLLRFCCVSSNTEAIVFCWEASSELFYAVPFVMINDELSFLESVLN